MKYGFGPDFSRFNNFFATPAIVVYHGPYWVRDNEKFAVMLRFLWWGIGVYVYEKE